MVKIVKTDYLQVYVLHANRYAGDGVQAEHVKTTETNARISIQDDISGSSVLLCRLCWRIRSSGGRGVFCGWVVFANLIFESIGMVLDAESEFVHFLPVQELKNTHEYGQTGCWERLLTCVCCRSSGIDTVPRFCRPWSSSAERYKHIHTHTPISCRHVGSSHHHIEKTPYMYCETAWRVGTGQPDFARGLICSQ